jgi:hypothetical protein
MRDNNWARLLAYVTGLVNQELLLQNEYLTAENRILKAHLPSRVRLADSERATLAEIGKRLGRKALREVACIAKPDTILAWYRKLIARKFDGSKQRRYIGRPPVNPDVVEALVVRFGRENPGWGYDRIVGALVNLGHQVSDQTVGNILRRQGRDHGSTGRMLDAADGPKYDVPQTGSPQLVSLRFTRSRCEVLCFLSEHARGRGREVSGTSSAKS